jgi:hypothetical protein
VSPPELTRDTPVTQIVDPVFECLIESFWYYFEFSFFVSSCDLLSHRTSSYEPLSRYNRLDTAFASRTESYGMSVWLYFDEISLAPEELDDIVSRLTNCW